MIGHLRGQVVAAGVVVVAGEGFLRARPARAASESGVRPRRSMRFTSSSGQSRTKRSRDTAPASPSSAADDSLALESTHFSMSASELLSSDSATFQFQRQCSHCSAAYRSLRFSEFLFNPVARPEFGMSFQYGLLFSGTFSSIIRKLGPVLVIKSN